MVSSRSADGRDGQAGSVGSAGGGSMGMMGAASASPPGSANGSKQRKGKSRRKNVSEDDQEEAAAAMRAHTVAGDADAGIANESVAGVAVGAQKLKRKKDLARQCDCRRWTGSSTKITSILKRLSRSEL
ncbi:unnamed protein product [Effrenium voratum]|uniref:Uncharacterized protein n=1 Tax=Effrenium voratum TaxID=2562239 RepID=A0AA36HZI4_9DINO|nr:unnamed protein product [Effrenium voratum]